jgi:hypothetical protein
VTLAITTEGEQVLRQQASAARQELQTIGPILAESISKLVQSGGRRDMAANRSKNAPREARSHGEKPESFRLTHLQPDRIHRKVRRERKGKTKD